jgi:hypothetical protein
LRDCLNRCRIEWRRGPLREANTNMVFRNCADGAGSRFEQFGTVLNGSMIVGEGRARRLGTVASPSRPPPGAPAPSCSPKPQWSASSIRPHSVQPGSGSCRFPLVEAAMSQAPEEISAWSSSRRLVVVSLTPHRSSPNLETLIATSTGTHLAVYRAPIPRGPGQVL